MVTRLHGNPRQCPVGGPGFGPERCPRTVRAGHLMCGPCWRVVPKPIQTEVWRTWRRFNKTSADEDWTSYLQARAEALAVFGTTQTGDTDARPADAGPADLQPW